jgi:NTE family protein
MKSLVLSGGSEKGAHEIGAIRYLVGTRNIQYDVMTGVSVGAIAASFLAQYTNEQSIEAISKLVELWTGLTNDKIYKDWFPFKGWHSLWRQSYFNSAPLMHLIREHINLDKIRASGKKVAVGAVSISSGKYTVFTQDDDDFIGGVIASASFPGFFTPVKLRGEYFVDGGCKQHTPIQMALDLGADEIDVLMTSPEIRLKHFIEEPNTIDIIKRALDLSSDKIMSNDLDKLRMYNKLAEAGVSDRKVIKTNVIRPQYNLTDDLLDFDPEKISKMMDIGYEDAKRLYRSDIENQG